MLMRKSFIIAVLAFSTLATFASAPVMLTDMGVSELIEAEQGVTLTVSGNAVQVGGASGMVLEVVSLTGRQVASIKIESPAQRVELNLPKGCYILKVGKVVRKITLR